MKKSILASLLILTMTASLPASVLASMSTATSAESLAEAMAATSSVESLAETLVSEYLPGLSITQEELEELKAQLQKEIDDYYNIIYELEEAASEDNVLDNFFSLFGGTSATTGSAKTSGAVVEDAMTEDVMVGETTMDAATEVEASAYMPEVSAAWDEPDWNTEEYNENPPSRFTKVATDPLSTFAADVDTGSFCNFRRMLTDGYHLSDIPSGAIRTEELLNYFDYTIDDANRSDGRFSVQYETTACPWNPETMLLLMTLEANRSKSEAPRNNFTFLLDTSGSMDEPLKLGLAKCSIKLLSYTLTAEDRVSIVTYSGDSYTALDSCPGNDYETIVKALDSIYPYGGTNGSGGIDRAYELAEKNFEADANNRVFILSDGDMNLGVTSQSGLVDLIKGKKDRGIFLSVLGFGSGNYSDANMEQIADAGNGNYFYLDCLDEAQHVLIEKQKETTLTAAKDVKFQAEFNPAEVSEYRLLGYENRAVADDDFKNDAVDGGEVGEGQQITVLYELKLNDKTTSNAEASESLKYQEKPELSMESLSGELLTMSINYKDPASDTSETEAYAVKAADGEISSDMYLAMSLAELSMLLRNDANAGTASLADVREFARKAALESTDIYRIGYGRMMETIF